MFIEIEKNLEATVTKWLLEQHSNKHRDLTHDTAKKAIHRYNTAARLANKNGEKKLIVSGFSAKMVADFMQEVYQKTA
jgi:hypothetical protein